MNKKAFTLAEVLITLAIIGIVAAMTLPALIEKHQKRIVVTRLKDFYSSMNQAVRMAEAEYGDSEYWDYPSNNNYDSIKVFFDKYFAPYLHITDSVHFVVTISENEEETIFNRLLVKFYNGSAMTMFSSNGISMTFYPQASKVNNTNHIPRELFYFNFNKSGTVGEKSFVEPYTYYWDGTRENLFTQSRYGCNEDSLIKAYCAKLIQYDGWQIKDDYPW